MANRNTAEKHKEFVKEPMGEKKVTELAGVGKVLGKRLSEEGYDKAEGVFGKFLVLKKDEVEFKGWMKETCGANAKQQSDTHKCVKEWHRQNF